MRLCASIEEVMIKKFLERIFLTIIFLMVMSVFVGIAYELQVAQDPVAYAQQMLSAPSGAVKRALFSPEDDVKSVLLGLIEQEKKHISLAIFTLTDKDIAQALIDAHERNILVEVVTDRSTCMSEYSKIPLLAKKNISIYVYPKLKDMDKANTSLMHNKFIIFDCSLKGKMLLWTGSFNLSRAASYNNQENVIILDDTSLATTYAQRFVFLKRHADRMAGGKIPASDYDTSSPTLSFFARLKQLIAAKA